MKTTTPSFVFLSLCLLLGVISVRAQTISQPPATLPVQSYSDDPLVSSSYSAALCSLKAILGTESAPHGIGPLTVNPNCMSMTLQPHSTASVNGQSLPSSGVVTIFEPSSSASASTAMPTTAPSASTSSSSSASSSSSSTAAAPTPSSGQTNAASSSSRPPTAASWIAKHNIGVLLLTTFAVLAGVTYFLDELLGMLV